MANIEIDPVTGAPIIKNIADPTPANPIMPVVAMPTASPGLTPITPIPLPTPPVKPATTPVQPSPALAKVLEHNARIMADATVGDEDDKHVSTLYPGIQQALREGGGDTQQQAQTFAKIKELLQDWSEQ